MKNRPDLQFIALSLLATTGEPVKEFRIFHAGANPNRNGPPFLFDEQAAQSVLESQQTHGVRVMMDLEHLSLDPEAPNYDPDARAWLRLDVRRDDTGGFELWAVVDEWTPDGRRRVVDGTQRYPSPAVLYDKDRRPMRIVNVGLVGMPALDNASHLLAASERTHRMITLKVAIASMALARKLSTAGVPASTILATLADGTGDAAGEIAGVNIADLADLLGVTEDPANDPAGFISALNAKLDEVHARLSGTKPASTPDTPAPDAMPASEVAAAREIMNLDGAASLSVARANYARYRDAYIRNEATAAKLAADRKALEDTERAELKEKLLATHTEDEDSIKDVEGLSLVRLRERVKKAEGRKALVDSVPNAGSKKLLPGSGDVAALSDRELRMCAEMKQDPKDYAARKAAFAARKAG